MTAPEPEIAYLDASAAVKLLVAEPETTPLREALAAFRYLISSELLRVELHCVAQRAVVARRAVDDLLAALGLLTIDRSVVERATTPFEPSQRALDALHLASALPLADRLAFFSYDHRQLAAARAEGLTTRSPGW